MSWDWPKVVRCGSKLAGVDRPRYILFAFVSGKDMATRHVSVELRQLG